jgi:hypothetical protein
MLVKRHLSVSGKLVALCGAFLVPIVVLGYIVIGGVWNSLTSSELEIRGLDSLNLVWPAFETVARGKDVTPKDAKAVLESANESNALGFAAEIRALPSRAIRSTRSATPRACSKKSHAVRTSSSIRIPRMASSSGWRPMISFGW